MIKKLNPSYVQLSVNKSSVIYLGLAAALCFNACQKEGTISLDNTNDEIGVELSDSTTVVTSTYQMDKIPSNGKGVVLFGQLNDEETGTLTVSSYFRVGNTNISNLSLPNDAAFDSIALVLPYSGYYYGDTTVVQRVNLYRLNEEMELIEPSNAWEDDEYPVFVSGSAFYTNTTFGHDASPLGTATFRPKPASITDTLFIRVTDSFGQELWQKIKDNDRQITNTDDFLDYFKGMVLIPDGKSNVVTGFNTDSVSLDLYYRYTRETDGKLVQDTLKMMVNDSTYQFNHIAIDRQNSVLSGLSNTGSAELAASQSEQKVMLQGLSGLVTKIRFPYLYDFVNRDDIIINKAELTIETAPSRYTSFPAPGSLNMFLANEYDVPKSLLNYSWQDYAQAPSLLENGTGGTQYDQYRFDLTEYVSNYRKAVRDDKSSLFLSLPTTDLLSKVDRLVVAPDENGPRIKLSIWYTRY